MKCPNCNMGKVWEKYDKNDEDIWVREILCPVCHHHDILEVPEVESLEDFAERMSQRIQYSVKFDMINCFRNKREYTDRFLLEDSDGSRIHIDIIMKPEKENTLIYDIDYTKCIHLEQVDSSFTSDGIEVRLYKCKKGHEICQKSMFDKPCEDFEVEGE